MAVAATVCVMGSGAVVLSGKGWGGDISNGSLLPHELYQHICNPYAPLSTPFLGHQRWCWKKKDVQYIMTACQAPRFVSVVTVLLVFGVLMVRRVLNQKESGKKLLARKTRSWW